MSEKKRLFALLVGINAYPPPVRPLHGAVKDIEGIQAYLEKVESAHFELNIYPPVLDKCATKDRIVTLFERHLGKAGPNDVALFYFSGHGVHEEADITYWPEERDGKLECLVCYNSITENNSYYNFLADKEIRWLINNVAASGAHVVTIFDCCHSGDNTRNGWIQTLTGGVSARNLTYLQPQIYPKNFPKRALTDFIFWPDIKDRFVPGKSLELLLPEGDHVSISACRNNESAWDSSEGGIFSQFFIEVLHRSLGAVTYSDLKRRVHLFIKNHYAQTPEIYVVGDRSKLYQSFLGKAAQEKPLYGNVLYKKASNTTSEGWYMDIGALQGISKLVKQIRIEDEDGTAVAFAQPGHITPGLTALDIDLKKMSQMDQQQIYRGYAPQFISTPLKLYIENVDQKLSLEQQITAELAVIEKIQLTPYEAEADYTLLIQQDHLHIVYPGSPYRYHPLVHREEATSSGIPTVINYLSQIADWNHIRRLHNTNLQLFHDFPIRVDIWDVKEKEEHSLDLSRDTIELPIRSISMRSKSGQNFERLGRYLKIRLKNEWSGELHVAILFLGMDFEVNPAMIRNPNVESLQPGEHLYAQGRPEKPQCIPFILQGYISDFNWEADTSFIKIIASTDKAALDEAVKYLTKQPLPQPEKIRGKGTTKENITRGSLILENEDEIPVEDWATRTIEFRLLNKMEKS